VAAPLSTATVSPRPILNRDTATFTARPGTVRIPMVNQLCPLHWLAISAMRPAIQPRHFPRESIIARLFPGEASIVKVEAEGQQGGTTLTTRSEPHNRRAIHAEPSVNPVRMRTEHGWFMDMD